MSFDAGGRDRNEMMTKCLMQWGRKWYPLKEWINFVESVHLYEFQLPSWSSILSSSSSASHYLGSGLCCLLGVTRYSYSLTSLMFCITQISPPAAAHPLTPAATSHQSRTAWQVTDRDSVTGTAPVTSLLLLRGVNSLSDWVWRCLQCKVWTLHCTARPSCCCAAAAIRNKTGSGHQHRDSGAVEPHCTVGTLGTEHEGPWSSTQCISIISIHCRCAGTGYSCHARLYWASEPQPEETQQYTTTQHFVDSR